MTKRTYHKSSISRQVHGCAIDSSSSPGTLETMQGLRFEPSPSWVLHLDAIDARVLAWVASRRSDLLVGAMHVITRSGDAATVVGALLCALLLRPGRTAALVAVSTVVGLALFSAAKRVCRRGRPKVFALLPAPDRFSMPSGHATSAWAIGVSVSVLLPTLAPIALAWALAVSISRVVLGVHYPFDVLVGALLGSSAAFIVLALA